MGACLRHKAIASVQKVAQAGDGWIHEIKLDGYRTAARLEAGKVRMLTRSGLDWTARFRPIAAALAVPKIRAAYLDGEIAVLGEDRVTKWGGYRRYDGHIGVTRRNGACRDIEARSEDSRHDMNVRITVKFLKDNAEVSAFTFICTQEPDLGAGVDAAVAFLRRRHPGLSLFDTSMFIGFAKE